MKNAMLCAFALLFCASAYPQAYTGATNVGIPANILMLSYKTTCPSGWTEVTTYQGYSLWAQAASGTAGATLGTGRATNTTDAAGPTYSVTGTNLVTTAGTAPGATAISGTTLVAGANTITPPATERSTVAPSAAFRLCKRA